MTSPKGSEPSMEEILASIRKIVADDPARTPPPAPNNAFAGQKPGAPPPPGAAAPSAVRPTASFGKLSEALRTTFSTGNGSSLPVSSGRTPPAPPSGPSIPPAAMAKPDMHQLSGASRPSAEPSRAAIDDELEDILSEPFSSAVGRLSPASSEPRDSAGASETSGERNQWAVWRSTNRDSSAGETAPTTSAPAAAPEEKSSRGFYPAVGSLNASSSPFEATTRDSASLNTARFEPKLPEAGSSSLFADIVPQRERLGESKSVEVAPSAFTAAPRFDPGTAPVKAPDAPAPSPMSAKSADLAVAPATLPTTVAEVTKPRGFMTAEPRVEAVSEPSSSQPLDEPSQKPTSLVPVAAAKSGPVVIAAMPPLGAKATVAPSTVSVEPAAPGSPVAEPPASTESAETSPPVAQNAPVAGGVRVPLPPRTTLFSRPFLPNPDEKSPSSLVPGASGPLSARLGPVSSPLPKATEVASTPVPRPALPLAAAQIAASSSALDALAAGLAASNATSTPVPSTPPSDADARPLSPPQALPISSAVTSSVSAVSEPPRAAPARTLEDSVAEMIKPMLQKWIDDNMPRIIEKALRNEASQPGGFSGQKPPGT